MRNNLPLVILNKYNWVSHGKIQAVLDQYYIVFLGIALSHACHFEGALIRELRSPHANLQGYLSHVNHFTSRRREVQLTDLQDKNYCRNFVIVC